MSASRGERRIAVGCAVVIAALTAHSIWEYVDHLSVKIPFTHAEAGIGVVQEGDFLPTDGGIPLERLPWVLDPASGWSSSERAQAGTPCGLVALCASRYPRWCGASGVAAVEACAGVSPADEGSALRRAGVVGGGEPSGAGLWLVPGPRLVLERTRGVELALDGSGLVARAEGSR